MKVREAKIGCPKLCCSMYGCNELGLVWMWVVQRPSQCCTHQRSATHLPWSSADVRPWLRISSYAASFSLSKSGQVANENSCSLNKFVIYSLMKFNVRLGHMSLVISTVGRINRASLFSIPNSRQQDGGSFDLPHLSRLVIQGGRWAHSSQNRILFRRSTLRY
jgi:hypothetical protein